MHFVDTSRANEHKILNGDLEVISSGKLSALDINGSGGERSTNAEDIIVGVKEYLDNNKMTSDNVEDFHIVIFSGSGGSGSVIGPMIIRELQSMNMTVCGVMIGDTKDLLSARNTSNTLKTLISVNKKNAGTMSLFYLNNADKSVQDNEKIAKVNTEVIGFLATVSLFTSGKNEGIDSQDMRNFFNQKNYNTITVPSGVYLVQSISEDIENIEGCTITNTRTLLSEISDKSPLEISSLHDKTGIVLEEDALSVYGDNLPATLTSSNGCMKPLLSTIAAVITTLETIGNNLVSDDDHDSDEDGLVF